MLEFLAPREHFNRKFDRGMILCEFSALREPEATRFPQIGAWLRAKDIEFNEVPTPQMLYKGRLCPDLYIANQLDAVPEGNYYKARRAEWQYDKSAWRDEFHLRAASVMSHGKKFHETFIEPMCRKITGRSSSEIAAKYHRAAWLPLYWPQTLRARKSIPTPFHYPRAGYAGDIRGKLPQSERAHEIIGGNVADAEGVQINLAFVLAHPRQNFSVAFIVDDSPIYRVTNQDACAGTVGHGYSRFVVEYRGECNVPTELARLGLATVHQVAYGSMKMSLPTIENVRRGWKPRPNINEQIFAYMEKEDG